jgi:hypothetical protein
VLKDYTATPPAPSSGEPFRVEAVVSNASSGAGQVEVDVSLTNKQTGEVIDQESKDIQMEPNQTQRVLFEINLPPSAKDLDPQSIVVDVEAHYPVE